MDAQAELIYINVCRGLTENEDADPERCFKQIYSEFTVYSEHFKIIFKVCHISIKLEKKCFTGAL